MTEETRPLVLVADDDAAVRGFFCEVLKNVCGLRTSEAASVAETLAKTVSEKPDAVFIDRNFPDGSAQDYCAGLEKAGEEARAVPKFVITGEKLFSWDETFWKRYGVIGYLVKPCRIEQLQKAVDLCLKKK